MTDLHKIPQQSLEALEDLRVGRAKQSMDVTALHAALAQQAEPKGGGRLPPPLQAEPVQEPFGYLWPTGMHPEFRFAQQKRDGVDGMPLYTAPPQRKPLTKEEIGRICDAHWCLRQLARAVERAHGIGEQL